MLTEYNIQEGNDKEAKPKFKRKFLYAGMKLVIILNELNDINNIVEYSRTFFIALSETCY